MDPKIKSQKEIVKIIKKLKKQGKKIVTYNGSFDVFHFGHLESLKEAKKQGDILIVPLNSDQSVRLYKGPNRPISSQEKRAALLAALECVDYVTIFNEINCKNILNKIKPNIHCNGSDWGKNCVERGVVEKNKGKIHILKWQKGLSASNLIEKILTVYRKPEAKAVFLDRDGTLNINQPQYLHKISQFKFAPGAISALEKLSKTDYKIIILTNQSGIGRGYFKEKDLKKLHQWLVRKLKKHNIRIDKIYHCPHRPSDRCSCRKPEPGMILQAVKDFNLSLNQSWLVGDDEKDVILGRGVNAKTIKIGEKLPKTLKLEPNYYAKNLLGAVRIILKR